MRVRKELIEIAPPATIIKGIPEKKKPANDIPLD